MNVAPVTVVAPDGTVYEPVRAVLDNGYLAILDREGLPLRTVEAIGPVLGGRRKRIVTSVEGNWRVEDICGCSSAKHALLREWRGVPAREGT